MFNALEGNEIDNEYGSFFGIWKKVNNSTKHQQQLTLEDLNQTCQKMIVAGYCIYGPSRQIVLAIGSNVSVFTYFDQSGEYYLTHPTIKIRNNCDIMSYDAGHQLNFDEKVKSFIKEKRASCARGDSPLYFRHVGNLVSDLHRTLMYGGIYLAPPLQ